MECINPELYNFGQSIKSASLDTRHKVATLADLDRYLFVRYDSPFREPRTRQKKLDYKILIDMN